jgi:hypothetical protein
MALMRKVEAIRSRRGMSKTALAAELDTTTDALRNWVTGTNDWTEGKCRQNQDLPYEDKNCASVLYCSLVIRSIEKTLRSRSVLIAASAIVRGIDQPMVTGSRARLISQPTIF